jgi:two-component system sensor histidine kinase DegS
MANQIVLSAISYQGSDMASTASSSKNRLKRVITNRYFWIVALMLAASTFLHYYLTPQTRLPLLSSFPLTRQAVGRIIFILPVAGAAFAFGQAGGLITLFIAVLIMLPRVFFISPRPIDALVETVGVSVVAYIVVWMIEIQEKEKKLRQKAVEELATVNAIAVTVSQSLDLDEILDKALGKVLQVLSSLKAKGGIFLLDAEGQKLHLRAHHGLSLEFVRQESEIMVGECLCGLVAESGEVLFVSDALNDPRHTRCVELDPHSHVCVPLKFRDRVLGVMDLHLVGTYQPGPAERQLFASIGRQIGVAIENARLHQDVARQLRIEQRLNEVAEKITSELELDRILPKVLQIAEEMIGADGGVIALLDRERNLIGYPYLHNLPQELADVTVPKGGGLAGEVMTTGRPAVIEDYPTYTSALPEFVEAGLTSIVAVPIVSGDQPFGALSLVSLDEAKSFSDRDVAILTGIGRQAGIAIENARLYENMRFYVRQITKAQEDERKRIARELHDDTAQALIDLSRRLDNLATSRERLSETVIGRLEEFQELIDSILRGVRRFSRDLRPSVLDDLGLLPALEWLTANLMGEDGIKTELRVYGDRRRLPPEAELALFRIVQEALNNVRKHSQALQVVMVVEFDEGRVRIMVEDDGQGFELPGRTGDLATTGKLGLIGMHERAHLLGGTLTVRSEPGKGTTVTVDVPV